MVLKNLLFYRLMIFNTLGIVGLAAGYWMCFIEMLMKHDAVGVIYGIAGLLAIGIFGSLNRGWKVSQGHNDFKAGKGVDVVNVRKMFYKNEYIQNMAGWSVLIGLFGNALGLTEALSGGADTLLAGAGIAFGSTVAGILVALWLEINFSMIRTATGLLLEDVSRKE